MPTKTEIDTKKQIKPKAINLAFLGIPLPSRKSLTQFPKYLLLKTQLNNRLELRKKQAAATIIKGVVGRPGTINAINPITVNNSPRASHRTRIKGLDFISSSDDCIYSIF